MGVGVAVSVNAGVTVVFAERVGVDVGVAASVDAGVTVSVGVLIGVRVPVGVSATVGIAGAVAVGVGVSVAVGVTLSVGVLVGTGVSVGATVGVWVAVTVAVGVGVGVTSSTITSSIDGPHEEVRVVEAKSSRVVLPVAVTVPKLAELQPMPGGGSLVCPVVSKLKLRTVLPNVTLTVLMTGVPQPGLPDSAKLRL